MNRPTAPFSALDDTSDVSLLRRFVDDGSQPAFDRIVERHRRLVYTVCRREVGDPALAEDVTQVVFLILARKASSLGRGVVLPGWLFQTALLASKNALRREEVRRRREQDLVAQQEREAQTGAPPDAPWAEIEPLLNSALASLGRADREALLLRFFEGLSFVEAGVALQVSEDAARMRVGRALERLRRYLAREGVALSAIALLAFLSEKAVEASPALTVPFPPVSGPAGAAVTAGLSARALTLQELTKGVLKDMFLMKIKLAALAAIGVGLAGAMVAHAQITQNPTTSPQIAEPQPPAKPAHPVGVLAGIQAQYDRLAAASLQGGAASAAVEDAVYAPGYMEEGKPLSHAQRTANVEQTERTFQGWTVRASTLTIHGLTARGGIGVLTAVVQMQAHSVRLSPPDAKGRRHTFEATTQNQDTWVMMGDEWRLKDHHTLRKKAVEDGKAIEAK